MSELEDMIGKILGDPAQMERITQMAGRLMGDPSPTEESSGGISMPGGLGKLLSGLDTGGDKAGLAAALGPYLKPERRSKLEKAVRISRMARLAGLAMEEYGDGGL